MMCTEGPVRVSRDVLFKPQYDANRQRGMHAFRACIRAYVARADCSAGLFAGVMPDIKRPYAIGFLL